MHSIQLHWLQAWWPVPNVITLLILIICCFVLDPRWAIYIAVGLVHLAMVWIPRTYYGKWIRDGVVLRNHRKALHKLNRRATRSRQQAKRNWIIFHMSIVKSIVKCCNTLTPIKNEAETWCIQSFFDTETAHLVFRPRWKQRFIHFPWPKAESLIFYLSRNSKRMFYYNVTNSPTDSVFTTNIINMITRKQNRKGGHPALWLSQARGHLNWRMGLPYWMVIWVAG